MIQRMIQQKGGFALGLVAGLLVGLALALGVALYITKAPIPFINKVPQRTQEQDKVEAERNRNWDPNAPLAGKPLPRPGASGSAADSGTAAAPPQPSASAVAGAPAAPITPAAPAKADARDPAAILAGTPSRPASAAPAAKPAAPIAAPAPVPPQAAEAYVYFVQAGAFTRSDEAEQQRARLALLGLVAKITEREQAGRTVYRVRVGPFPAREAADNLQAKLQEQSIESQIVRVEKT